MQYPYVVVRYIATVYSRFPVRFVDPGQEQAGDVTEEFVIVCPIPFVQENLSAQARQTLIETIGCAVQKTGHRMCVVFGDNDCVYCEYDGSANSSFRLPSGGISCLRFPVRRG